MHQTRTRCVFKIKVVAVLLVTELMVHREEVTLRLDGYKVEALLHNILVKGSFN